MENRPITTDNLQDDIDPEALQQALKVVPQGALALAALTVGLLVLAYVAMFLFVYLPRGEVG